MQITVANVSLISCLARALDSGLKSENRKVSQLWLTKYQWFVLLHDVSHSYCINIEMRFVIFSSLHSQTCQLEGKCIPLIPPLVLFFLSLACCVLLSCWADLNIINFLFTQVWVTEVLKWLDFNYIAVIFFLHGKRERDIREKLPAAAVKRQWMCGAGEHGKGDLGVIPAFPITSTGCSSTHSQTVWHQHILYKSVHAQPFT